jgi:ribosomal protein S18 acetylase RimI-like enzyme
MLRYSLTEPVTVETFRDLLIRSTLAERRPVEDRESLAGMLRHADVTATCWEGGRLVGIARSVTDFTFCCYLSDLAVDEEFQRQGIGKALIALTQTRLGARCKIILLAAPAAVDYYPRIGFTHHPQAWLLPPPEKSSGEKAVHFPAFA